MYQSIPSLISLFSGPGGLDEGFKNAGFAIKLAYDNDPSAVATHRFNHPEAKAFCADLSTIETGSIIEEWNRHSPEYLPVGVIGGPPCQSFSISNVRQTDDDPRHLLPEHYARILAELNSVFSLDFFVFENVLGLIKKRHRERFERFKKLLEDAGFYTFEATLDAKDYGVPQRRKRVFLVGINRDTRPNIAFEFPKGDPDAKLTVAQAIGTLTEPTSFSRQSKTKGGEGHANHWCMAPKSRKFTEGSMEPGKYTGRSFRVLDWNDASHTVAYGHNEVHVHPEGHRRLSVYEAMLLQGFPRDYQLQGTLTQQIHLVSEAVPPPVAKAIADELKKQLGIEFSDNSVWNNFLELQSKSASQIWLTDQQWSLIQSILELPRKPSKRGRPPTDDRKVFNGVSWLLRTGKKDMPVTCPSLNICLSRLECWIREGKLERALGELIDDLFLFGGLDISRCYFDRGLLIVKKRDDGWERFHLTINDTSWLRETLSLLTSPITIGLLKRLNSSLFDKLSPRLLQQYESINLEAQFDQRHIHKILELGKLDIVVF